MKLLQSNKSKTLLVGATALTGPATASAALPEAAAAAMTSIGTLITDFIDTAWPLVVAYVIGKVGIKLFKRFSNTVTS